MNTLTENNHAEMKTVVETFIIEETQELIYDGEKLDKWNDFVSELGLKGQTKIVKPDKSPIPFMHMKQSLINIAETLCPRKVNVKDYDVTPIPLDILKIVGLSVKEQYFGEIQIWYDDKKPDPFCVGIMGYWEEPDYYASSNKNLKGVQFKTEQECKDAGAINARFKVINTYLLGKWGDVKRSFEELKKMAIKRYVEEQTNTAQQQIKYYQRQLDDAELEANQRFS